MAFSTDNITLFLTVLECGSFSAAARKLGRVPSAVSMAIAQLEAELDLQLFNRSGREPVPTEAALALEPQARQLSALHQQMEAHALALHRGLETRLTLAIAPELLATRWSEPIPQLAAEFPALELEILAVPQEDAMQMLHRGSAHLAVVFERPTIEEREVFQEMGSEKLIIVAAPQHPLAQVSAEARHEHLLEHRQIMVAASRDAPYSDPRLVQSRQLWRTDNHLAALRLVQEGLGWALLPVSLVQPSIHSGDLIEVVFTNMTNERLLWADVVWSTEKPLGLGAKRYVELIQKRQRGC
ncbi:LysR family transcriptional regulator [Pokkaliibacter plantistimulans]|uniref:LysR family transcriptional regulator n=1 Tax=Proteobacteria bacterium 228 TaxID=2083153 RepID=A0A2S5KXJ9_9PROT|nr:LysR family transcriptional regulator [Pokkaliibacter plantistimulans]PPC79229.1 LysR family transcriptional regulator [Pokkaliibacter plantistimulans]